MPPSRTTKPISPRTSRAQGADKFRPDGDLPAFTEFRASLQHSPTQVRTPDGSARATVKDVLDPHGLDPTETYAGGLLVCWPSGRMKTKTSTTTGSEYLGVSQQIAKLAYAQFGVEAAVKKGWSVLCPHVHADAGRGPVPKKVHTFGGWRKHVMKHHVSLSSVVTALLFSSSLAS